MTSDDFLVVGLGASIGGVVVTIVDITNIARS